MGDWFKKLGQTQQNTSTNTGGTNASHSTATGTSTNNTTNTGWNNNTGTNYGQGTQSGSNWGTSNVNPWAAQSPFITQGFDAAAAALAAANGTKAPTNFVAGFDPRAMNIFQQMSGFGNNATADRTAGVANRLGAAGGNHVVDALADLNAYRPAKGGRHNILMANEYANNPAVSGMVDSAMRGAERQVAEQYLPATARAAAGTGNINSSKHAIAEGIAARGLAEKRADIGADLRGKLYSQGLEMAEGARRFDNDSILKSLMARSATGLDAVQTGIQGNSAAIDQQQGIFDIAGAGADASRGARQLGLDNQMAAWQFGQQSPFAGLNNYWNIVGGNNWGGSTTNMGGATGSTSNVGGSTSSGTSGGSSSSTGTRTQTNDMTGANTGWGTGQQINNQSIAQTLGGLIGSIGSLWG
jgi:hypothetical protein